MSLLLFALVAILILALLLWAVDMIPLTSPFNWILRVILVLIVVVLILEKAGYA